jgi:hypothetical protein
VRIVDVPKFISSVPQSGQNATRQSPLPERLTFLCRLFAFIGFTIQISGRVKSAEAVVYSVETALATCSARLLTLAGYQYLGVLDGWLFIFTCCTLLSACSIITIRRREDCSSEKSLPTIKCKN